MTEQTVQIKMEKQKEAGPPDSPGQEWRLDRAQAAGGGGIGEGGVCPDRVPQAQRRRSCTDRVTGGEDGAGGRRDGGAAWRAADTL